MTMLPVVAISSVYPSGGAFAASSTPMLPFAPPRLSITNCCPRLVPSLSAMVRVVTSTPPPAANGTIHRTGFTGHVCEYPAAGMNAAATRLTQDMKNHGRVIDRSASDERQQPARIAGQNRVDLVFAEIAPHQRHHVLE